jgi:hypothetical protein
VDVVASAIAWLVDSIRRRELLWRGGIDANHRRLAVAVAVTTVSVLI